MQIFLNHRFVPAARAVVPLFDRGLLYGDGLFETVRVHGGQAVRLTQHLARLQSGADFLRIKIPYAPEKISALAVRLLAKNKFRAGLLRLTLTRGVGARGYSPRGADTPTFAMSLHPLPPPKRVGRLVTAALRLPAADPLARHKTANKLVQILARAEADEARADEALLLNSRGQIAETTSANIFIIVAGKVLTPPVSAGILPGLMRAAVLELCAQLGLPAREQNFSPARLRRAEGVFLTSTAQSLVEVTALDGHRLRRSPLVKTLRAAFIAQLAHAN
ncbi:MAG: branched-chain-amino-acid transaminase [Verrucomicrobiota bacterium]